MVKELRVNVQTGEQETVELTTTEEAKFNDLKAEVQSKYNDDTAKNSLKASGKQKLIDLGLTEEEIKALIGV
jgi:predicted DNA binding protein